MFNHTFNQSLVAPDGILTDSGSATSGNASTSINKAVAANGGGATAVALAFAATGASAGLQSLGLLSTVPCVVTLTGSTAIDGVSTSTVTLQANVMRHVTAVVGAVTALSVGANTDSQGAAGTIQIEALYYA